MTIFLIHNFINKHLIDILNKPTIHQIFAALSFPIILFEAVFDEILSVVVQDCEVFVLEDGVILGVLVERLDLLNEGIDIFLIGEGLSTAK